MAYSLLYVSKCLLERTEVAAEVVNIAVDSAPRNAARGITGALISTGTYFTQLLEGPREAVDELMGRIDADPRHMRPRIIRTAEERRRFASSPLVYNGFAGFLDRQIVPFFSSLPESDAARLALRLVGMMEEFARLPSA
jgi:hypothetical protein